MLNSSVVNDYDKQKISLQRNHKNGPDALDFYRNKGRL